MEYLNVIVFTVFIQYFHSEIDLIFTCIRSEIDVWDSGYVHTFGGGWTAALPFPLASIMSQCLS